MYGLIQILFGLLDLVSFVIFVSFLLDLLIYFEVVSRYNKFVYKLDTLLKRITEPMFDFVRRYIRPFNGLDLAPLVILIGIQVFKQLVILLLQA